MKNLILIITFIISINANAQQEPIFSQFWNAKTYYNPGMTGVGYKHLSTTIGRWQNVGISGMPVTQLLGYAAKIKKIHGGLGFTYMHETIDSLAFNKTKFNYAYQIATETGGVWSIGLGAGFNAMQMERAVTTGDTKGVGFTADLGIVYSSKKANFSLSCTQLNNGRLMDSYSEKRHLVLMTDYIFGKDEGLQLKPQVFVMTDLVKVTYDINAMVFWKQKLGAGVTFRSNEDLSFSLNWDLLKKFRIGYAYDLVLGDLKGQTDGSHTAFFGLVFK